MLDILTHWLQGYPAWQDAMELDYLEDTPGSAGMFPRGIRVLESREDVQGNVKLRCACDFLLRRSAARSGDNARWLLELQLWAAGQQAQGLAPTFGDEPKTERLWITEGKLDGHSQVGSSHYTARLTVEFTKYYEVK